MKVVSQTLLGASAASRTQSRGKAHYLRLGKGLRLSEVGNALSSLSGCCLMRMPQSVQRVNQNMWSCEILRLAPVPAAVGLSVAFGRSSAAYCTRASLSPAKDTLQN